MDHRCLVLLSALLTSCGDDQPIETAEDCTDAGGRVAADPGYGVMCEADEEQIGTITKPQYFEPPICCRAK